MSEIVPGRARSGLVRLGAISSVVVAAALLAFVAPGPREEPVRTVFVPTPPPPVTVIDSIRRGQTLGQVLEGHGFSGLEIMRLVEAFSEYESPRRLRPGTVVTLISRPAERPNEVGLRLDADRTLHLFAEPAGGEPRWRARLDSVEVVRDTILIGGLVETNLYNASLSGDVDRLAPGEPVELVFRISQIFQWQVDFWRDIRRNDAYRAAIEREVRPDGTVRSARIIAAEFQNAGERLVAIRFQPDEEEPVEYFDADGEALRSQFLFAPLDLARVTSGFSYRRYHPILRVRRPHLGVDYGAPRGTPVRATGPGVVTRAGPWGGYGNAVEIRHANNFRTRYAHLSSISSGVRAGLRIDQGRVIGRVGSTGLSTSSHLHYEFLQNGQQVNPARLDLPRAEPVSDEHRPAFELAGAGALALLDGIDLPGPPSATAARTDDDDD